ncbi:Alpha-1,3-mannosyltransferase-like protein [Teratosphaeriaceae sp. CCFEE 6253]|nr:Alpha-1,3-mannosyltransferase-like protein [Teratosphaeriaceae sp. CCFEE 6253]
MATAMADEKRTGSPRSVVFVHPDLGIGGAERLVIDAAVGLQSLGHKVTIITSYRNKAHCFEEARDGTLDVRVRGDAIFPASIAGGLSILCAMLRQIALVFSIAVFSNELKTLDPDVIFVDQLSVCIPFFRVLYPKAKVLFYGHFPDQLLAKEGNGLVKLAKMLYRAPFDAIEGWSTGCADSIVVNSKFTRAIFRGVFPGMKQRELKVIYPCVDTTTSQPSDDGPLWPDKKILLSINRFEGKKNVALAIRAYAGLSQQESSKAKLIISGGFDPRNHENAATHKALQALVESLELTHATFRSNDTLTTDLTTDDVDVLFLLSIPNELKHRLLRSASLLIYTPQNEHFGIVPLEAMIAGVPVLATNTGGPLETIYDGRTGFLRSPDKVDAWTDVMRKPLFPSSEDSLRAMGQRGRERVLAEFSHTKMTESLESEVQSLCRSTGKRPKVTPDMVLALAVVTGIAVLLGVFMLFALRWGLQEMARKEALAQLEEGSVASSVLEAVGSATAKAMGREEL